MIKCKVLVRLTVEVEREAWSDGDRSLEGMFKGVASDAVSQVRRDLADRAIIVGQPVVESVLTLAKEVEVPKP